MTGLPEFIAARLDEWERLAKGARPGYFSPEVLGMFSAASDMAHVISHDPAQVLREVAALRAVLNGYTPIQNPALDAATWLQWNLLGNVLRHLAAIWADHPDYEQGWRP